MDSKDVMAWINRGDVLRDLKKYQESCDCYDKALKINEKNAEAWGKKGLTLNLLKEQQEGDKRKKCEKNAVESFRRGIEICNDALKKEPKDVTSLLTRGQIFGYQKDHVTALISFNDALEVDSNNVEALINKCIAYCNLGLENKARECIKDANNITADRIPNMLLKGKVLKKYGGIETTFPYPGEETISGMSASYRADFTTVIAGCQTDKGQKAK
jgi:tetratricopeptide (TPR) repeat protein